MMIYAFMILNCFEIEALTSACASIGSKYVAKCAPQFLEEMNS